MLNNYKQAGIRLAGGGMDSECDRGSQMKPVFREGKRFAVKLISSAVCALMLSGLIMGSAWGKEAEGSAVKDDPYRLVDLYCSQSAKDALGYDQLQVLVHRIVTSIEPQAVNLLIGSFPCFQDAAAKGELGREIGLYVYYGEGDQDGIKEHETVLPGVYAYVYGFPAYEAGESIFRYLICMDAQAITESITEADDGNRALPDPDQRAGIQLDTTFCHELFHAFMDDYNRVGMSGYTDFASYLQSTEEEITTREGDTLIAQTAFPIWFVEGLAGCVGNIYPADLILFHEYHYDPDRRRYFDLCTNDQLRRMYSGMGFRKGRGKDRYDLEAAGEDNSDGHVNGAVYVSGYLACLYLAELGYRESEGQSALSFSRNGEIESISSEKLRKGLGTILSRLHRGDTLDEVISEISGGSYKNTQDFTKRFIKGEYNGRAQDYAGDPESLSFCVKYLNYMSTLDAMDPETHPAGSLLMDDPGSTEPTPLQKDLAYECDYYRIAGSNTLTDSTVLSKNVKDGGTSYSGRDSFQTVVELFRARQDARESG